MNDCLEETDKESNIDGLKTTTEHCQRESSRGSALVSEAGGCLRLFSLLTVFFENDTTVMVTAIKQAERAWSDLQIKSRVSEQSGAIGSPSGNDRWGYQSLCVRKDN